MATAAPNSIDTLDIEFRRRNTSWLFRGEPEQFNQCSLLATASLYGLLVIGGSQPELQVVQLSEVVAKCGDAINARTIPLSQPARSIALSCDHSMLAVNYTQNGSTFLTVFSVPSLLATNVAVLHQGIVLSPDLNVSVRELLWNPVIPGTLAVCLDNGSLCVLNFNAGGAGYELHTLDKSEQAQCASWSPKGKQIVVGFPQGKLAQYKPDLKLARTIPCAADIYPGGPYDIVTVQWLSTYQFAAALLRRAPGECPAIFIVNAAKNVPPVYINYDDICYSQSGPRRAQVFIQHVLPWNLLLIGSANSVEIGVLGTREQGETPLWTQYTMADEWRAEVPLTADKQESYPIGVAIETGCTHQLTQNESTLPVMPILHLLSTGGHLTSFDLVNRIAGLPTLCQAPKQLPDTSGAAEFRPVDVSNRASNVAAAPTATSNFNDMTFMVAGNATTSTPAVVQKSKPSMFAAADSKPPGVNLFGGGVTAASAVPDFGHKPPPNNTPFGSLGTTAPFSGFGAPSANAPPAFGSTAFGTAKPSFGVAPTPVQAAPFAAAPITAPVAPVDAKPTANEPPTNSNAPFLTVPQNYANPPSNIQKSTTAATANRSSASQMPAAAIPGGDDDKVIRKMIAEEIAAFEQDWSRMLARSRDLRIELGTRDEMGATAKQLAELQDISGQATESTDTLTLEIQSLRLALNETFAMLTEAQTKRTMFGNMDVNTLRDTSTMSQTNRRQMERLQRQLAVNEHQFHIVNKQIDAHWSAHEQTVRHNARAKMHIPQLENVYMTMSKQRDILNAQKQRIAYIKSKIGYRALPSSNGTSATPQKLDTSVNSLSDSIFSMSLCDQVKLETERLSATKMVALRELLKQRQHISVIKPMRPARKGLTSEVVMERKIALEKKVAAVKATPVAATNNQKASVQPQTAKQSAAFTAPMPSFAAPLPVVAPVSKPKQTAAAAAPKAFSFGDADAATPAFGASPSFTMPPTSQPPLAKPAASFGFKAPDLSSPLSFGAASKTAFGSPAAPTSIAPTPKPQASTQNPSTATPAPPTSIGKAFGSSGPTTAPVSFGFVSAPSSTTPAFGAFSSGSTTAPSFGGLAISTATTAAPVPSSFSFAAAAAPVLAPAAKPQTPTLNALLPKGIAAAAAAAATTADKQPTVTTTPSKDKENQPIALVKKQPAPDATKPIATSIFGGATTITPTFGASAVPSSTAASAGSAFGGFGSSLESSLPATSALGAFAANTSTTITAVKPAEPTPATVVSTAASVPTVSTAPTAQGFTFSLGGSTTSTPAAAAPAVVDSQPNAQPKPPVAEQTVPTVDKTDTLFQGLNVCKPNVPTTTSSEAAPVTTGASLFAMPAFGSPAATTSSTTSTAPTSVFGGAPASTAFGTNIFGSVPPATSAVAASTTSASAFGNVFGSLGTGTTTTTAAAGGNIFGGAATMPKPEASVFAAASASAASSASTNVFGAAVPSAALPVASSTTSNIFGGGAASVAAGGSPASIFGGGVAAPSATSPFGAAASTGGSIFGQQSTFGQTTSVFGAAPGTAAAPVAASDAAAGASIFGGGSIFGGASNGPAAPASGSIFGGNSVGGGGTLAPSAFGSSNIFGSPAGGAAATSSSAFGAAPSIFSSPTTGAQPAAGGSMFGGGFGSPANTAAVPGAFGGAPAFGSAPSFGGAASFGSPKGGFGAFGQTAASPPAFAAPAQSSGQSNSLFESLGSSETGMTFGNIAQNTAAPAAPGASSAFGGGSSFSSWR